MILFLSALFAWLKISKQKAVLVTDVACAAVPCWTETVLLLIIRSNDGSFDELHASQYDKSTLSRRFEGPNMLDIPL